MVVNAGLADTDNAGNIRIAEPVIAARENERARLSEDFFGSAGKIGHAAYLPSSRYNVNP
ncbi:hypothetical protein D3C87_1886130 [compost metagenome]